MAIQKKYDFIVLGGGSGGYAAARTGVASGLRVLVIDGGTEIGGLCILRGCMPSKTLIESANRYRVMRECEEFGLGAEGISFSGEAIIARKRRLIKEFADYRAEQLQDGRFDFVRGLGRFVGKNKIRVREESGEEWDVEFAKCLVATGSETKLLGIPGLKEAKPWTSDDVLDSAYIPASIIVLGGGAIALELAHYYGALGVEVKVIQRSAQVLRGTDKDMAEVVVDAFRARGIEIFTDTELQRVEIRDGKKVVHFLHEGVPCEVVGEEILECLGRKPATGKLNLEALGVEAAKGGALETGLDQKVSGGEDIYAAGDVCGPYEIVHLAIEQGEIAARNAARELGHLSGKMETMDYRLKMLGIFCEPQVASVGLGEEEAREEGRDIEVATHPFDDHGKSMVMGELHGFVKLVVDRESREIIGGGVVGPHAVELIHEVAVAMAFRATAGQFAKVPHYHPTLSEIWTYPAEDLA